MRSLKYIVPAVLLAAVIGWQQLKAMIVAEGPLQEVVNVVIPKGAGTKLVAQELKKSGNYPARAAVSDCNSSERCGQGA